MKARLTLALAVLVSMTAWVMAQPSPNPWFQPTYGVGGGGGGGGGDITAVGDCTSGDCLTSGTTTMAGAAVFSSATAIDVRGGLQNTGSAACFGSITGVVCVPDASGLAVSPASGDAVVRLSNPVNTGSAVVYLYAQSSLVGGLRWSDVGSSDADYSDKLSLAATNKLLAAVQSADISAGSAMFEWRDNAAGTGVRLAFIDGAGNLYTAAGGTRTRGSITLAAGTGTATVSTGAVCTCTDRTAVAAVQCSVSGTTLTANGTGTDVISYLCIGDA